jgi:hypothetical protein
VLRAGLTCPVGDSTAKETPVLAAYSFGDVMWSMFVFFAWVLFLGLLFFVFKDLFSRPEIPGWAKAVWTIVVIVLPFLGIFVYLIVHGFTMGERDEW